MGVGAYILFSPPLPRPSWILQASRLHLASCHLLALGLVPREAAIRCLVCMPCPSLGISILLPCGGNSPDRNARPRASAPAARLAAAPSFGVLGCRGPLSHSLRFVDQDAPARARCRLAACGCLLKLFPDEGCAVAGRCARGRRLRAAWARAR